MGLKLKSQFQNITPQVVGVFKKLDYASRNEDGVVPKFSDKAVAAFQTKNGRVVYDGGGIQPDIKIGFIKRTAATKKTSKIKSYF